MNNSAWLVFSFSVPSRLQGFRVKIWRKLNALGAVQIKNSIYVLPAGMRHQEQLTWMAKETDEQGGEALIIANGELLNIADAQVRNAFTRARDEDYASLEDDIRAQLALPGILEVPAVLSRFEKRLEAVRAIDFFPSGKGEAVRRLLDEAKRIPGGATPSFPRLDALDYRGKTWVTRADPYVDRLASFWLVRRFVDPEAGIRFLAEFEPAPAGPEFVLFDMPEAGFTHMGGLITFEVLVESFRLGDAVPDGMRRLLHAIDLEEQEEASGEAAGVKRMLDGLVSANPGDMDRMDQALLFFDTLLNSYTRNNRQGQSK